MSSHPELRVTRGNVERADEPRLHVLRERSAPFCVCFTGAAELPPSLHVLRQESDLLPSLEPVPQVLDGGELHPLSVFTVNVQEDAEEHQEAAPDVPGRRRLARET